MSYAGLAVLIVVELLVGALLWLGLGADTRAGAFLVVFLSLLAIAVAKLQADELRR